MSLSRLIARPLMATAFVVGPLNAWRNAEALAPKAQRVTGPLRSAAERAGIPVPQSDAAIVRVNAAVQVAGALALATGRYPRLGAAVLAGSLVPTTVAGHAFWDEQDPTAKNQQRLLFGKNLSLLGGLILAARDTDGRPGLAWRARRATKDATREAKSLARTARQEARIVKAKAS